MNPFPIKFVAILLVFWSTQVAGAPLTVFFLAGDSISGRILDSVRKEIESRSSAFLSRARFDGVYRPNELVIAFGVEGARAAASLDQRIPVLNLFIPKHAFEKIMPGRKGGRFSVIYIDQPVSRQMRLVRLAFPEKHRIGVLLGPDSRGELPVLEKAASEYGLELSSGKVESQSQLFSVLDEVVKESDVILAVPDPLVFNSGTISGILLTAYRYNIPLVGFSPSYAKAGALIALYSTVEQVGWQAAEAVSEFAEKGVLPSPAYPSYFTVGINRYVARSMGVEIQDEATFEEKLSHMEGSP